MNKFRILVFEFAMGNPALVSVIIPLYNRLSLIEKTLQSVSNQTYRSWEVIVVDDGSTDGSYELVKKLAESEPRIKLFRRDREPKGAPVCRNIGIAKSSGKYLIFLDSDDILAPFCLQQRLQLFQKNSNLDFLVFQTLLFNSEVNDLQVQWNIETDEDDLQRFFALDALWQTTGPIYKKEAIRKVGGFREGLPFWQDFDLHLRCLLIDLSYKKFFDQPPDNYHRKNFKDSISRTIPFVEDTMILQKRIEYYHSLIEFISEKKIEINSLQKHALRSVLFFFTSSYYIKHNNLARFFKEWRRVGDALNSKGLSHFLSFFFGILQALSKRHVLYRKMLNLYALIFKGNLPDYHICSTSKMGKVERKL